MLSIDIRDNWDTCTLDRCVAQESAWHVAEELYIFYIGTTAHREGGVTIFFDDSFLFVSLKAPKGPTDTITGTTTYLFVRFLAMIV